MAFDESGAFEQVNSLKAILATKDEQIAPLKEKVRAVKEALCARDLPGGGFEIDFDALVDKLGLESCMELRKAIDERWRVSGAPGEKPRVRVAA